MSDSEKKEKRADQVFQTILSEVAVLKDAKSFQNIHGFSLSEYIGNRGTFTKICRDHADQIETSVFNTGIAKTTGGSVGIVSGAAAIGGVLLAPFTAGLSLGFTIGGIAGGVASAVTTITSEVVKNRNLNYYKEEIEKALETFKEQEEKTGHLFQSIQDNLNELRVLMKDPSVVQYISQIGMGATKIGYNIVYQGVAVARAVNAAKLAKNLATFIQADFAAIAGVAQGIAAPGLRVFGKTFVAAGGTAAKVFGGAMGVLGIGMGIWEVVEGAQDINGSEVAESYRKFADDYDEQTLEMKKAIDQLTKL